MSGAALLRLGATAAASSVGGSATPPDPVTGWTCYGAGVCSTAGVTLSGSDYHLFTTDLSGGGTLYVSINGAAWVACPGLPNQHLFQGGQTLSWMIQNGTDATVSGTCTITDVTSSTVIATFDYLVQPA